MVASHCPRSTLSIPRPVDHRCVRAVVNSQSEDAGHHRGDQDSELGQHEECKVELNQQGCAANELRHETQGHGDPLRGRALHQGEHQPKQQENRGGGKGYLEGDQQTLA